MLAHGSDESNATSIAWDGIGLGGVWLGQGGREVRDWVKNK